MGKSMGLKYFLNDTEILKWLPLKYKKVPQFKNISGHFYIIQIDNGLSRTIFLKISLIYGKSI